MAQSDRIRMAFFDALAHSLAAIYRAADTAHFPVTNALRRAYCYAVRHANAIYWANYLSSPDYVARRLRRYVQPGPVDDDGPVERDRLIPHG